MLSLRSGARVGLSHLRNFTKSSTRNHSQMRLSEVETKLESFAPLAFAEKWDNVGVLVQPSNTNIEINKILLTNDLTLAVLDEAIAHKSNLIISYHPPIFSGLKRLTMETWKEMIIVKCIENQIAIFSPHTSWDAAPNGVNDWLADAIPSMTSFPAIPSDSDRSYGAGRICQINGTITLGNAIDKIKSYTGLPDIRVGIAANGSLDSPISRFGVCAGSGASVLAAIKVPIGLFITGELSHHEALDATQRNIHVITLNHSNSERGFLKKFKTILGDLLDNDKIDIVVSAADEDPLKTF